MPIESRNPATGALEKSFEAHTPDQIDRMIEKADKAYRSWRKQPVKTRAEMLHKVADRLDARRDELAAIATREMGKTLASAKAEVQKCALGCRYYADHAERFLADSEREGAGSRNFVSYQPIGPILAVMPWNFPYWQVLRFAAPATAAGNVGLLKHASNVPQCALAIAELFEEAGYPEGIFQTILVPGSGVEPILRDPRIAAATLTGSEPAGASVAAIAGSEIKKVVLELGGSDPFIVMPSADQDKAVATAVTARLINNGQSCIAAKRFIVHDDVYDGFVSSFVDRMKAAKMGDPMDETTELGPLATDQIRQDLIDQVHATVKAGATVLTGGEAPNRPGNYYPATVLVDVPEGSPGRDEELFGPAAVLLRAGSTDEAIRLANASRFGLGSSAWTNDPKEQEAFIRGIEAGSVMINQMMASTPGLPFGGVKKSGVGRELSYEGLHEFTNVKTVSIA